MITRHYFINAVKYRDDGSGSFSWCTEVFSVKSWFVDPDIVYQTAYAHAVDGLKNGNDGNISIQSINRL